MGTRILANLRGDSDSFVACEMRVTNTLLLDRGPVAGTAIWPRRDRAADAGEYFLRRACL